MTRHEDRLEERMKDPAFRAAYEKELKDLTQHKAGDTMVWVPGSLDKDGEATPKEKIAIEKQDLVLTEKVMERDPTCWSYGCDRPAHKWVREIQFDMKGDKVGSDNAVVDTRDYGGPVPGFCWGHDAAGPRELAEAVYNDKQQFKWGLPVTRWWCIYTDGTKTGGGVEKLNLPKGTWGVTEEYSPGSY